MIPKFNEDRIAFLRFIKNNKHIFDILLYSGRYRLTIGFNKRYVEEAYNFMIHLNKNMFDFIDDLNEFTNDEDPAEMEVMVSEFVKWVEDKDTQTKFRKESNKLLEQAIKSRVEPMNERRKTMKRANERTAIIKDELLHVEYEPDDRKDYIKGKTYREKRAKWYAQFGQGAFTPPTTNFKGDRMSPEKFGGKKRKTYKKRKT